MYLGEFAHTLDTEGRLALPARLGDPLHAARRTHDSIISHSVAIGAMQPMSPFVDIVSPRLDGLGPPAIASNVRDAAGRKDAEDLVHRRFIQILGDEQIH